MNDTIQTIAVYALPVLFAITLHEAAHAYVAKYFGDSTAYSLGRMSLNPIKHIDPFGTILLPLVLAFIPGAFVFGYAKPVPIDFGNLRKPKRDMAWVALAGPAANFLMAILWAVLFVLLSSSSSNETLFVFLRKMGDAGVRTNLLFFAFNLLPLPPLDGGRILTSMLPHKYAYKLAQIEPYGFFILLLLLYLHVLEFWVGPITYGAANLIGLIVSPLNFFLN